MAEKTIPASEPSITILVCGRTGIGKSSLINEIFGASVCPTGGADDPTGLEHVTKEVQAVHKRMHGVRITIYDSPGLQDGTDKDDKYVEKMSTCYNSVDLVLYCIDFNADRWLPQENNAIEMLSKKFGAAFWERVIVVFTKANKLQNDLKENFANWEPKMQGRFATYVQQTRVCLKQCNVSPDIVSSVPFVTAGFKRTRKLVYVSERCGIQKKGVDYLAELWTTCLNRMKSCDSYMAFMQATFSSGRYVLDQKAVAEVEEEERKGTQASQIREEVQEVKESASAAKAYALAKAKEEKERMDRESSEREQEIKRNQKEERNKKKKEDDEERKRKAEEKQREKDADDKAKKMAEEENEAKRKADKERKRREAEEEDERKAVERKKQLQSIEDKRAAEAQRIRTSTEEQQQLQKCMSDAEARKWLETERESKEEEEKRKERIKDEQEREKVRVHQIDEERIGEIERKQIEAENRRERKEKERMEEERKEEERKEEERKEEERKEEERKEEERKDEERKEEERKEQIIFEDVQVVDDTKVCLDYEQTKQALKRSWWQRFKDFVQRIF